MLRYVYEIIRKKEQQYINLEELAPISFDCISLATILNKNAKLQSLALKIFYQNYAMEEIFLDYYGELSR